MLRDAAAVESLSGSYFTLYWRLREFLLTGKEMDLPAMAEKAWFGPLRLEGLPLTKTGLFGAKNDLALQGKRLSRLSREELFVFGRVAEERLRALRWLVVGGAYAEIDTSA